MKAFFLMIIFTTLHAFDQTGLNIGFDLYHLCLKNHNNQHHILPGAVIEFNAYSPRSYYLGFKANIGSGNLYGKNYYGLNTHHFVLEKTLEGKIGYNFFPGSFRFTPYSGLGFYSLDDDWCYSEVITRYRNFYLPLGISMGFLIHHNIILGINMQTNVLFNCHCHHDGHPVLTKKKLRPQLFYLIELPLSYTKSKVDFRLIPYVRWGTLEHLHIRALGGQCEIGYAY